MKRFRKLLWIPLILLGLMILATVVYLGYLLITVVIPILPTFFYAILK